MAEACYLYSIELKYTYPQCKLEADSTVIPWLAPSPNLDLRHHPTKPAHEYELLEKDRPQFQPPDFTRLPWSSVYQVPWPGKFKRRII